MKTVLRIFKHSGDLCIDVTGLAKVLGWEEGDTVEAIQTSNGVEIVSLGMLNARAFSKANDFMERYPNAMKRLAE